jgi:hypothetical protein
MLLSPSYRRACFCLPGRAKSEGADSDDGNHTWLLNPEVCLPLSIATPGWAHFDQVPRKLTEEECMQCSPRFACLGNTSARATLTCQASMASLASRRRKQHWAVDRTWVVCKQIRGGRRLL